MHEMSLCEGILQIIEDKAAADGFTEVRCVRLEIGKFAGVEIDALRFGFDVVMKGSVAEQAELDVIELPGQAFCFDCTETVSVDERLQPCPACGGHKLAPSGGDEMRIKELEVA